MNNTTHTSVRPRLDGPVAVTWLLLFIQGAIAVTLSVEAVGSAIIFGGFPLLGALLTVAATTFTLVLVARLPKLRRSTRKWIMSLQVGWITMGLVDMILAIALAGRGLTLVGFFVRMVLPATIFWLLRRPAARAEFGATKMARKARKKEKATDLANDDESWDLEEVWA